MEQPAFADLEYRGKRRRTRRGPFLEGQGPVQSGGTGPELQLRRRQLQKQGDSARGGGVRRVSPMANGMTGRAQCAVDDLHFVYT